MQLQDVLAFSWNWPNMSNDFLELKPFLQVVLGLFDVNMNKVYYMMITTALLIPLVYIKSLKRLGKVWAQTAKTTRSRFVSPLLRDFVIRSQQSLFHWQSVVFVSGHLGTFFSAPFSLMANVMNVVGLVIILQYCVRDLPPIGSYPAFNSWSTLPLYFGTAIYAFEGIGVVSFSWFGTKCDTFLLNELIWRLPAWMCMQNFGRVQHGENNTGRLRIVLLSSFSFELDHEQLQVGGGDQLGHFFVILGSSNWEQNAHSWRLPRTDGGAEHEHGRGDGALHSRRFLWLHESRQWGAGQYYSQPTDGRAVRKSCCLHNFPKDFQKVFSVVRICPSIFVLVTAPRNKRQLYLTFLLWFSNVPPKGQLRLRQIFWWCDRNLSAWLRVAFADIFGRLYLSVFSERPKKQTYRNHLHFGVVCFSTCLFTNTCLFQVVHFREIDVRRVHIHHLCLAVLRAFEHIVASYWGQDYGSHLQPQTFPAVRLQNGAGAIIMWAFTASRHTDIAYVWDLRRSRSWLLSHIWLFTSIKESVVWSPSCVLIQPCLLDTAHSQSTPLRWFFSFQSGSRRPCRTWTFSSLWSAPCRAAPSRSSFRPSWNWSSPGPTSSAPASGKSAKTCS